jgi:hypothetical protein
MQVLDIGGKIFFTVTTQAGWGMFVCVCLGPTHAPHPPPHYNGPRRGGGGRGKGPPQSRGQEKILY